MTIQYLSPIFTTIIAIFLLSEKVKTLQWLFYAMAFCGCSFYRAVRYPDFLIYLALGIISAFCSGVAYNLVRSLREREHPLTVVLHFQLVGAVAGLFRHLFRVENAGRLGLVFPVAGRYFFADGSDLSD